jgi:hypothetical protein
MLGVSTSAVNVASVTDVATAGRRRGLLQTGGVSVEFTVATSSSDSAASLTSAISAIQSDATQLATFASIMNTQLASNGVSVTCSVALSTPTQGAPEVSVPALNVSTISNATEAAAALTSALSGASGATASAAQSALLTSVLTSTVVGNASVSSGSVTTAAALVLAVVSVPGTALTAAVQQSALATLASVAQNAANMSAGAGQSLLTTMLAVTTNANVSNGSVLSSASTEAAAAVMATAVSAVTSSGAMTAATAATVMQVLQTVAAGSINVNASTGGNIVSALSTVATSSTGQGNTVLLRSVSGVLDTLVSSQAASMLIGLSAGGPAPLPAITSSPSIKMLVQVDFAGGASSRLSTTSLTVEGSGASFAPMPANLFDGNEAQTAGGVVTEFRNLAFDPYGDNATTGVTRLAFTTPAGAPIVVEGKSTPIRFTLPPVALAGGDDLLARCQFYDQAAGAYATAGCVGVPSPQPAGGHVLDFVPGYTTPNDASLALAWRIVGPMVDGGACLTALLDCSRGARPLAYIGGNWTDPDDASLPDRIYPDPRDPLNVPAVTCPPLSGGVDAASGAPLCTVGGVQAPCPVLRVVYGGACALWRPDNAAGCHWDNVNQSFKGPRCVADQSNGTQCMCRHVRAPCCAFRALLRACCPPHR